MRRYIISKNRRFRGLASNQRKVMEALEKLHDIDDLYIVNSNHSTRSREPFLALTRSRLNNEFLYFSKVEIFTQSDLPSEDIIQAMRDNPEPEDSELPCKRGSLSATFGIREVQVNVIVDDEGDEVSI
jgi:hypothetical protein